MIPSEHFTDMTLVSQDTDDHDDHDDQKWCTRVDAPEVMHQVERNDLVIKAKEVKIVERIENSRKKWK